MSKEELTKRLKCQLQPQQQPQWLQPQQSSFSLLQSSSPKFGGSCHTTPPLSSSPIYISSPDSKFTLSGEEGGGKRGLGDTQRRTLPPPFAPLQQPEQRTQSMQSSSSSSSSSFFTSCSSFTFSSSSTSFSLLSLPNHSHEFCQALYPHSRELMN